MSHIKLSTDVTNATPRYVKGVPNILYVGSGDWATEMKREYGEDKVFATLPAAIAAVPAGDGSSTYGFYNTKIIVHGTHLVSSTITIPITKSGITIEGVGPHAGSAGIYTTTALGAGVPLLKVLGYNVTLKNFRVWAETTVQTGDAIHWGDATYGALYGHLENVHVLGPSSGSYLKFVKGIVLKDAKYTHLVDCEVDVATGSTAGISIEAGVGNGRNHVLKNCHVHVLTDTGDAVKALDIAADQEGGIIDGGSYVCQSTADAIEIDGAYWTLTGGVIAANESAVSADAAPIDNNVTTTVYGECYVKQINGATQVALATEA